MVHLAPLLALLLATLNGARGAPPADVDCSNPRVAADSLFVWLRPDRFDPKRASACMDVPPGADGRRLAVQLKHVLDARGYLVPVATLSTDPDHRDESGQHRLVPMPDDFPTLVLEKQGDRWVYARETMEAVPSLYGDTFSALSLWFQKQLPSPFYNRVLGLYLWQYLYGSLLLAAAWVVGRIVNWLLRNRVRRWLRSFTVELDEPTYKRTQRPLTVLVMCVVVLWGTPDVQLPIEVSTRIYQAVWLIVGIAGVFLASRFVNVFAKVAESRAHKTASLLDNQLIPLLRQGAQVVVWTLGVLFVLQNHGVDVVGLVAGLGIGGLAFALAAKDTVANLFGSLNIFADRPFQIGDEVVIGDIGGFIEEVGFRSTRIRTYHASLVTLPNSVIANATIDNWSARKKRHVNVTVTVTYDTPPDKLQAFVEGIRAILAAHPQVDPAYWVYFRNFGASGFEILLYYYLKVPNWSAELEVRSQNFLEIIRLADELGVTFALPSTRVYVASTPDRPLAPAEPTPLSELERTYVAFGPDGALARPYGPPFGQRFLEPPPGARAEEPGD